MYDFFVLSGIVKLLLHFLFDWIKCLVHTIRMRYQSHICFREIHLSNFAIKNIRVLIYTHFF